MKTMNKNCIALIAAVLLPAVLLGCGSTAPKAEKKNYYNPNKSEPVKVMAMDFDASNNVKVEKFRKAVGYIKNGSSIQFNEIDFGKGSRTVVVEAATQANGGKVEVRLGDASGKLLATVPVVKTGKWDNWQQFPAPLSEKVKGKQKVTLVFVGGGGFLFNVKSLEVK